MLDVCLLHRPNSQVAEEFIVALRKLAEAPTTIRLDGETVSASDVEEGDAFVRGGKAGELSIRTTAIDRVLPGWQRGRRISAVRRLLHTTEKNRLDTKRRLVPGGDLTRVYAFSLNP